MSQFEMKSPPVGCPIQFFPNGDKSHPHAAVVTESGINGMVKLNYQFTGGGELRSGRRFIRFAGDPYCEENPHQIRVDGCWGYVPGLVSSPESSSAGSQSDPKWDESREKIESLYAEGVEIEQIALKMRSRGLSKSDVEKILLG